MVKMPYLLKLRLAYAAVSLVALLIGGYPLLCMVRTWQGGTFYWQHLPLVALFLLPPLFFAYWLLSLALFEPRLSRDDAGDIRYARWLHQYFTGGSKLEEIKRIYVVSQWREAKSYRGYVKVLYLQRNNRKRLTLAMDLTHGDLSVHLKELGVLLNVPAIDSSTRQLGN